MYKIEKVKEGYICVKHEIKSNKESDVFISQWIIATQLMIDPLLTCLRR